MLCSMEDGPILLSDWLAILSVEGLELDVR